MSDDSSPVYHGVNYSVAVVDDIAHAVCGLLHFIVLRRNQVEPKEEKHISQLLPKQARSI